MIRRNRLPVAARTRAGACAWLATLKEPCAVTLHTDSSCLRNGITQWLKGWKRNGWRTAAREPVKNDDLWKQLDAAAAPHRIEWRWLKGHAGHADNERCDQLAAAEMAKLRQSYSRPQLKVLRDQFLASREPLAKQPTLL